MKDPLRGPRLAWHRMIGSRSVTLDGVTVSTDPADVNRTVQSHLFKGIYEGPERDILRDLLQPGQRVLEIGTGVGLISLLSTRLTGEGNVTSFEANPALENVIRKNYATNGWTPDLRMKAVTSDGAPLRFFSTDNILSSSIHDRQLDGKAIEIESVAMKDALAEVRPDVIVMDVEGAETQLFAGVDLAGVSHLLIELHPHIVGQEPIDALIADLAARGFPMVKTVHKNGLFSRSPA